MSFNLNPSTGFPNLYDSFNSKFRDYNPIVIFTLVIIVVFYYIMFNSLGSSSSSSGVLSSTTTSMGMGDMFGSSSSSIKSPKISGGMGIVEMLFWGLLLFLIVINGLQYFFSLDINAAIKNIFSPVPEIDITVDEKEHKESTVPEIMFEKQVFHIPGNEYTYDDAQALCQAYDARLASYEEIESSYKDGAEWCSYGWSKDQLALFPTQKETYNKLQKVKGHENDCGRPGINGGFIDNKKVRFGVNCYGYKPEITPGERDMMSHTPHYPVTEKDKKLARKVEKYRKNLPNIMVSPFNNKRWSII